MEGSFLITIVHAVLALLVIIELGLTAYIVNVDNGWWGAMNFQMFNVIWSILVLIYLAVVPLVLEAIYHGLAALVILCLTALFWFAGSTAVAADIGVPACGTDNFCRSTQAECVFGYFIWIGFTGLAVIGVLGFMKTRGRGGMETAHPAKPGTAYPGV